VKAGNVLQALLGQQVNHQLIVERIDQFGYPGIISAAQSGGTAQ